MVEDYSVVPSIIEVMLRSVFYFQIHWLRWDYISLNDLVVVKGLNGGRPLNGVCIVC